MFLELHVASHHNAVAEYFHFLFVLIFFCIRYCIKIDNTVYHFTKFFICARFISIEATLPFRSVWKKYVLCSDLLIEYLVTNMHIIYQEVNIGCTWFSYFSGVSILRPRLPSNTRNLFGSCEGIGAKIQDSGEFPRSYDQLVTLNIV